MKQTCKRTLSILLSLTMILSLFTIIPIASESAALSVTDSSIITVSEALQNYKDDTDMDVQTQRIYFQMPNGSRGPVADYDITINKEIVDPDTGFSSYQEETILEQGQQFLSWENEYNLINGVSNPAIYWYSGSANCQNYSDIGWVGYRMEIADADQGIFYADVPLDVQNIIINNGIDGGTDTEDPIFSMSAQTIDIDLQGAHEYDYDSLPYGSPDSESFDGCIFILDPNQLSMNQYGNVISGGNWYVYYGNGCYGGEFEKGLNNNYDYSCGTPGWTGNIEDYCQNPDHFEKVFHVNYQQPEETVYTVVGSSESFLGSLWDISNAANDMTEDNYGFYNITYSNVEPEDNIEICVVKNHSWNEYWGDENGNSLLFSVKEQCDVTVIFDPESGKVIVEGDGIVSERMTEIYSVIAVGNGENTYLHSSIWDPYDLVNLMTEVAPNIWELQMEDIYSFDNYIIKFVLNSIDENGNLVENPWKYNLGTETEQKYPTNQIIDLVDNGNYCIFEVEEDGSSVIIQLDLTEFNLSTFTGARMNIMVLPPDPDYDDQTVSVNYIDENSEEQTASAIPITNDNTVLSDGWYAVTKDVVINDEITCKGDVHLILCDDTTLKVNTVTLEDDGSLTVYGQSGQTGEWEITTDNGAGFYAFIDTEDVENALLTVNGGIVTVKGSYSGVLCEDVVINRGTLDVTCSETNAVAINVERLTVSGGTVNATGGSQGDNGIGIYGEGGITISDGTVRASGLNAGIYAESSDIRITGGNVTATTGETGGICGSNCGLFMSWTKETDSITATYGFDNITLEKAFVVNGSDVIQASTLTDIDAINGKVLIPANVYNITVESGITGGTVTADKAIAIENELVTLTVKANDGYAARSVTVNGEAITPNNGVYSFEMPAEERFAE